MPSYLIFTQNISKFDFPQFFAHPKSQARNLLSSLPYTYVVLIHVNRVIEKNTYKFCSCFFSAEIYNQEERASEA